MIIMDYIWNMLPFMVITTPIYIIIRFVWHKKNKVNWYHEIALFFFCLFLIGLASQTIIPRLEIIDGKIGIANYGFDGINLIPFKVITQTYNISITNGYINYFIINFLGNIMIFMPIGFCIPLLWKITDKKVILIGFLTSLFIEICQLFLNRGTDIDDLILNTLGVILGLLVYKLFYKKFSKALDKFKVQ